MADRKIDVVVIGAGIAGLAASLEAKRAGARVIVLEKLKAARGNTYYSGGGSLLKISGTPREIVSENSRTGKDRVDKDLVRTFALNINEGIDWLSSMGLQWYETIPTSGRTDRFGQAASPRLRVKGHGAAICRVMVSAVEKAGIEIQYQTEALKIITNGDGKVAGLRVKGKVLRILIETPPFYAEEVTGMLNCTLGGIKINSEAQVLNGKGALIPGLFAAGEIMGGFYYDNYQVITGYLPVCLVFGRLAGKNAVQSS